MRADDDWYHVTQGNWKIRYECMTGGEKRDGKGKRGRKDRDSDSDSDSDGDMAREYWNKFARMNYRQFAQGYRHAEPGVTDEQIRDSFLYGDKNGDFELDFHEFQRLVAMKEGPPDGDHEKMRWYWKHFASYKNKGMTEEEFYMGSQVENEGMSWDEAMNYFRMLDHNGDGRLTKNEFYSMSEMEGHEGKSDDEMTADDYWQKFSKDGKVMTFDSFVNAYEHAEKGVSKE